MIITFRSPASGDVIMFGDVAKHMMQLMGKAVTDEGIVTVEQLPDAIARLRAAVDADKAARTGAQDDESETKETGMAAAVSLTQRAVPLLELLEWSLKKKKPVTWG
ncbi:MAG: DUF1840 domain-containing protein [Rhodocyclaceae bacterium]|nr:MAG: DUF1840 domain-containing protein [Rhodocyclaceae bacterium]